MTAAESPGPREDNPSGVGGVLIIAGIILGVILLAVAIFLVFGAVQRRSRRRVGDEEEHPAGRVGRLR